MNFRIYILAVIVVSLFGACAVSYKMNGASIDYSKTKTITIADFPNQAPLVYPPLSQLFSEGIRDIYSRQTRLQQIRRDGDLSIEGEIITYNLQPLAIGDNALATETRITMGVKVRFVNKNNPDEDFERTFTANRTFATSSNFNSVQEELCNEMIEEITDQIYNATVANW